jgi:hypothetical protein
MVFHGFLWPTSTNPMLYAMNDWHEKKRKHKYDDMIFSLLDHELSHDFYKSKIKLNPTLELPPQAFIIFLQMWIENIDPVTMRVEANLPRYPL